MYLYCCRRLLGRDYQESAEQSDPLPLLCQTVTHRPPGKYEKTSAEVGNARKSAHYRPHLRTPFPFDFEFFVVAIPLNVPGITSASNNGNIFSFAATREEQKNHRADNTWRNTAVITERSDDIFPDRSRNAIVKFVHDQFCQPVIDRRVKGFQLRRGKFITCVGNHFFQRLPG